MQLKELPIRISTVCYDLSVCEIAASSHEAVRLFNIRFYPAGYGLRED